MLHHMLDMLTCIGTEDIKVFNKKKEKEKKERKRGKIKGFERRKKTRRKKEEKHFNQKKITAKQRNKERKMKKVPEKTRKTCLEEKNSFKFSKEKKKKGLFKTS